MLMGKNYSKSQSEAVKLFFENSIGYTDDLYTMGNKAFPFYFSTLKPCLLSQESEYDSGIVNAMVGILKFRMKDDSLPIKGCLADVLRILTYVSENGAKFDATPEIYGDLAGEVSYLMEKVQAMGTSQS